MTAPVQAELATTAEAGALADQVSPPWRRLGRRFWHNRAGMAGLIIVLVITAGALFAPLLAPHDPAALTRGLIKGGPLDGQNRVLVNHGPLAGHWLGTDDVGRDILSRLLYGARVSMQVSVQVILLAVGVALPLGLVAGYIGRWVDAVIMRVMDAMFTFPPLILALAVAALLGHGLGTASVAIAVVFIPGFVRIIRAQVLAVREEAFIEASRSVGIGSTRMLRKHILPAVAAPLTVQVAVSFGYALLAEAGLSFLGFGVQPPNASWGTMLQGAYGFVLDKPWPLFPPGVAIVVTVLAFNLIGDGLRDSLGREVFTVKEPRR
jgi:peptide/nickel transport system permease protein